MKKVLAVLLTLVLVVGMLPIVGISVSAVEEGDAPAVETLPIKTAEEFAAMDPAGAYSLEADIEISETFAGKFTGTLDGKGHKITVSDPIFAEVNATISNIVIEGSVTANEAKNLGALACFAEGGKYTNIINNADVTGLTSSGARSGGVIGFADGDATIELVDCVNNGDITGYETGGIIGLAINKMTVTGCKNFGNITSNDCGGGISGWFKDDFTITDCVNGSEEVETKVAVSGGEAGGILGYISANTNGTFTRCINYATLGIAGTNKFAGGVFGRAGSGCVFNVYTSQNFGTVNCKNEAGGAIGEIDGSEVKLTQFVNYGDVSSNYSGGAIGDAEGGCTIAITQFTNYGEIYAGKCAGGAMGYIGKNADATFTNCTNMAAIYGEGDSTGGIAGLVASNGGSTNSIIKFINCVNNATVDAKKDTAGGILGYSQGKSDVTFKNCLNTGDVTASASSGYPAGGIAGQTGYLSSYENCVNLGDVTNLANSKVAGGIVAYSYGITSMKNCINVGTVTSNYNTAGGIVGTFNANNTKEAVFENCINLGLVENKDVAAGIIGFLTNSNKIKLINCVNLGKIIADSDDYDSCALYYLSNGSSGADIPAENIVDCFYLEGSADQEHHYGPNAQPDFYVALETANPDLKFDDEALKTIKARTAKQIEDANFDWNLTEEDYSSGYLCYYMNKTAGGNAFYQTLGEDAFPVADPSHLPVMFIDGRYINAAYTGDSSNMIALIVVAVVSLFGMGITAVVLKRKIRN